MSLDKLHEDSARAARAQDLIQNELLNEAFDTLKQTYIAKWEATTAAEHQLREKYWLAARGVDVLKQHLHNVLQNGKLAEVELKRFAEDQERKRRFGIL